MKITARILLGILFPFILVLTVTTISKALKADQDNSDIFKYRQPSVKNSPVNSSQPQIILTRHSAK